MIGRWSGKCETEETRYRYAHVLSREVPSLKLKVISRGMEELTSVQVLEWKSPSSSIPSSFLLLRLNCTSWCPVWR